MSRLYQRKGTWSVDFTDERGVRIRRVLKGVTGKREAEAELAELVAQVRRRELGLEPAAKRSKMTVWEVVAWWLDERCPKASLNNERRRLTKHLKGTELGDFPAVHARPGQFEAFFAELEHPAAPRRPLAGASINHLRSKLRTAFERARREDIFVGRNPLLETKLRKVVRRVYETLSADEALQVLAKVPPQWRGFVAAAIYLGLRKGEIAGLRKRDVDLVQMMILIGRSYTRDTTKGGHGDLLPIPELMRPYLELALASPGLLLFPDSRGRMRKPHSKPCVTLRRAIANADVVVGYRLICRRCTTDGKLRPEVVSSRPKPPRACPVCKTRKLWVTPLPRHVRFHDLRHSTATILLRAGVDAHRVQKLMRHSSFDTTSKTYAHLIVEDLRAGQATAFGTNPAKTEVPPEVPRKEVASK